MIVGGESVIFLLVSVEVVVWKAGYLVVCVGVTSLL